MTKRLKEFWNIWILNWKKINRTPNIWQENGSRVMKWNNVRMKLTTNTKEDSGISLRNFDKKNSSQIAMSRVTNSSNTSLFPINSVARRSRCWKMIWHSIALQKFWNRVFLNRTYSRNAVCMWSWDRLTRSKSNRNLRLLKNRSTQWQVDNGTHSHRPASLAHRTEISGSRIIRWKETPRKIQPRDGIRPDEDGDNGRIHVHSMKVTGMLKWKTRTVTDVLTVDQNSIWPAAPNVPENTKGNSEIPEKPKTHLRACHKLLINGCSMRSMTSKGWEISYTMKS